jgi:hypothetical protein
MTTSLRYPDVVTQDVSRHFVAGPTSAFVVPKSNDQLLLRALVTQFLEITQIEGYTAARKW